MYENITFPYSVYLFAFSIPVIILINTNELS